MMYQMGGQFLRKLNWSLDDVGDSVKGFTDGWRKCSDDFHFSVVLFLFVRVCRLKILGSRQNSSCCPIVNPKMCSFWEESMTFRLCWTIAWWVSQFICQVIHYSWCNDPHYTKENDTWKLRRFKILLKVLKQNLTEEKEISWTMFRYRKRFCFANKFVTFFLFVCFENVYPNCLISCFSCIWRVHEQFYITELEYIARTEDQISHGTLMSSSARRNKSPDMMQLRSQKNQDHLEGGEAVLKIYSFTCRSTFPPLLVLVMSAPSDQEWKTGKGSCISLAKHWWDI